MSFLLLRGVDTRGVNEVIGGNLSKERTDVDGDVMGSPTGYGGVREKVEKKWIDGPVTCWVCKGFF